jgi:hypothetical protein
MLALNINTGKIVWSRRTAGLDNWTVACWINVTNPQNCPDPEGPDYGKFSHINELNIAVLIEIKF